MKRPIIFILTLALLALSMLVLAACGSTECTAHADNDGNGVCDTEGCGVCVTHNDADNNGVCDNGCGNTVAQGKFCPECGHKFVTACPKCGAAITSGAKFCLECGEKL